MRTQYSWSSNIFIHYLLNVYLSPYCPKFFLNRINIIINIINLITLNPRGNYVWLVFLDNRTLWRLIIPHLLFTYFHIPFSNIKKYSYTLCARVDRTTYLYQLDVHLPIVWIICYTWPCRHTNPNYVCSNSLDCPETRHTLCAYALVR